jgi:hypothetical protein
VVVGLVLIVLVLMVKLGTPRNVNADVQMNGKAKTAK